MHQMEKARLWFGTCCLVLGASGFWAFLASFGVNYFLDLPEPKVYFFIFFPLLLLFFLAGIYHYVRTAKEGVPIIRKPIAASASKKHLQNWVAILVLVGVVLFLAFGMPKLV